MPNEKQDIPDKIFNEDIEIDFSQDRFQGDLENLCKRVQKGCRKWSLALVSSNGRNRQ